MLAEDLDILEQAWRNIHPGLFLYQTENEFGDRIARLRAWAQSERSHSSLLVEVSKLAAQVRCGHTFANPANQGKLVRERYLERRDHVPFAFRWIEGQMTVTDAVSGIALGRGDVIAAINGVTADRLLGALMPFARADGSNDAKRVSQMEVRPGDGYPVFDLCRNLVFPIPGQIELTVLRGSRSVSLGVDPVTNAERLKALPGAGSEDPTFKIEDGIGVMRFFTWAYYGSKTFDWKGFIDRSVDALIAANGRGLILDNRGNEGGIDVGNYLLERLIAQPVALPQIKRLLRYRKTPAALNPHLDTWDDSFRDWGDRAVGPDAQGFYVQKPEAEAPSQIAPRGSRFAKPFILLCDAANSSATFQFAQIVKDNRLGTLVGMSTGGNRRGINGGAYFFLRLPNSRIEVDLPLIGQYPVGPQPDQGIMPDVLAPYRGEDIASGRDHAMEVAKSRLS